MIKVYVLCEGKTERAFVDTLLYPHFFRAGVALIPIVCMTKREPSGVKYTGGISTYGKIRNELLTLCHEHSNEYVTMMFDFYRLPRDTPGKDAALDATTMKKVLHLEERISQDIGCRNFVSNIIMHEFEGLLFSMPDAFAYCGISKDYVRILHEIRNAHDTPEHIDDGETTAPSKRILAVHPQYSKVIDGIFVAETIGIEKILSECPHFSDWTSKIMKLNTANKI